MKLLKFYLTCRSEGLEIRYIICIFLGSILYQRALLVSYRVLSYWKMEGLPIASLIKDNITFFSEESGEIALSDLALSLPSNHKGSIEETRRYISDIVPKLYV